MDSSMRLTLISYLIIVSQLFCFCDSIDKTLKDNQKTNELKIKDILNRLRRETEFSENDSLVFNNPSIDLSKTSNISWDEINETFDKYLSEEEVQQKWNTMEQNMKSGISDKILSKYLFYLICKYV